MQVHSFENMLNQSSADINKVHREPTNEEISLQYFMGLAYGAKHLLDYAYYSGTESYNNGSGDLCDWGMRGEDPNNMSTRRYHNYYGQEKWSFISNLNLKVRNIGDFMYEDNNLVWDDALTVDKPNPFPFKYFQDIRSKAPLI